MVIRMVEEEEVSAVVLVCQVPIHPGIDNGGKRSSVMLVGLLGFPLGRKNSLRLDCSI